MQLPVNLKLPVLEVITAAFRLPVQMRVQLVPAIQLPLVLLLVLQAASMLMGTGGDPDAAAFGQLALFALLGLAITAMIAVPAHQIFISGQLEPGYGGLRWTGRETGYLGWSIGLPVIVLLLASLISMPILAIAMTTGIGAVGNLAILLGLVAGIAVYGRFSMVLPRLALGQRGGLRAAGQMAAGHYWRVGVIGVVFPLLISLVPIALQSALGALGMVLAVVASIYFSVVQIAALALVYRWLMEFAGPPEADQPDEDDEVDPDRPYDAGLNELDHDDAHHDGASQGEPRDELLPPDQEEPRSDDEDPRR